MNSSHPIDTVGYVLAMERTLLYVTLPFYSEYAQRPVIQKGCTVAETRQPGIKLCLHSVLPYEQGWERQSKGREGGSFLVFCASGLEANAPNRSGRAPVLRNLISYNLMPTLVRPGCQSRFRWSRSKANAAGKCGIRAWSVCWVILLRGIFA